MEMGVARAILLPPEVGPCSKLLGLCFIFFKERGYLEAKQLRMQTPIRLRLFPFSLNGKATTWFMEYTHGSISNWKDLEEAFLDRYFLIPFIIKMRGEIVRFKQYLGESLFEVWARFKKK